MDQEKPCVDRKGSCDVPNICFGQLIFCGAEQVLVLVWVSDVTDIVQFLRMIV